MQNNFGYGVQVSLKGYKSNTIKRNMLFNDYI